MPLAVVPMNVPLSNVTIGKEVCVEGAARTVTVATHTATSKAQRKNMTTRQKGQQAAMETVGQHHEKESRL